MSLRHPLTIILLVASLCAASDASSRALIVRYEHSGDYAVEACSEFIWQQGSRYRDATRDRSPSLDRWHAGHDVRGVRAIFRQANGEPLAAQARGIERRLGAGIARRHSGSRLSNRRQAMMRRMSERARELAHVYRIELADTVDLEEAMTSLADDPHVAFVQRDHANQLDFEANDPFLASSGSWSQPYLDLWGLARIGAFEAWQITRGAGQVVAVVDTGLDYEHPDIAENVWINQGEDRNGNGLVDASDFNGLDDDGNGFVDDLRGYDFFGYGDRRPDGTIDLGDADPFDENGHGTHVAGIVAALANNDLGIAGVAPEAKVMPLKGFGPQGSGRDSDLWRAVLYAIENGANVINASWSCAPACSRNPLAREVLAIAQEAGVVFVTSAGNQAFDVIRNAPENSTAAITVGSIGANDALSRFSSRGWLLDLIAPGGGPSSTPGVVVPRRNILSLAASTLPEVEEAFVLPGGYWRQAGTSMSSPHVAGAVALLRAHRPGLRPMEIRRLLRTSAEDLPPIGHDPVHGAGLLDLPGLLSAALPDLQLEILAPGPGEILSPTAQSSLTLRMVASGLDLARYSIAFSRGLSTSDFQEIARGPSLDGEDGVIWPVESLSDGPYVIRLRATLQDGRTVDEFTLLGLERNRPLRLSAGKGDESEPSISGRRVAWRAVVDRAVNRGEIRAGGFGRRAKALPTTTLSATERTQQAPILSGRRAVWLERDVGTLDDDVRGCRLSRRASRGCKARTLARSKDAGRLSPVQFGKGRLLWSPRLDALGGIVGCLWRRGFNCRSEEVVETLVAPTSRRLMAFDGRTLLLSSADSGSRLEMCRPVLRGDGMRCSPRLVIFEGGGVLTVARASIDGSLVAIELFRPEGALLGHCQLDLETAVCRNPRFVETLGGSSRPAVSGRRLVWQEEIAGEDASIAFCERDALTAECPRQRLVGVPAPAGLPSIDGHRVVWQDARLGPDQIYGLELPRLQLRKRVAVRPGTRRFIPVVARKPDGGILRLELEGVQGPTPEAVRAKIVTVGRGWAVLVINPPASVGKADSIWRIKGRGSGGLVTQEILKVHYSLRDGVSRSNRARFFSKASIR